MDFEQIFRFLMALVFVLGLIAALSLVAKRIGFTPRATRTKSSAKRRLSIVEVLSVDAKRRLILVRRDATEHLVLLGVDRDLVVEAGLPAAPEEPAAEDEAEQHSIVRSLRDLTRLGPFSGRNRL